MEPGNAGLDFTVELGCHASRMIDVRDAGSVRLTMITVFGVKKNKYSNIVSGQVMLEDLFRPVF